MLKICWMAADFQNVYRYSVCLWSSAGLADVLEHHCNPVVGTFFSFTSVIRAPSVLTSRENSVNADC